MQQPARVRRSPIRHGLGTALCVLAACSEGGGEPQLPPPEAPQVPEVGGCPVFTPDDAWNTPIASATVNEAYTARLQRYLDKAGSPNLHPDFGGDYEGKAYGIPINVVPMGQPLAPVVFEYPDESDPGPYPIPLPGQVRIEGDDPRSDDGNRYVLVVQQGSCRLFEAWGCKYDAQWRCGLGASFDLRRSSYGQRPKFQSAAAASGMPVLAGLVRHDEAESGTIRHALRFALDCTSDQFTAPASNAGVGGPPGQCDMYGPDTLPMGVRLRLAAKYDITHLQGHALVVAQALQTYGMILAVNGSDLYIEGEPDARWNDEHLNALKDIPGSAFEVVDPVVPEP